MMADAPGNGLKMPIARMYFVHLLSGDEKLLYMMSRLCLVKWNVDLRIGLENADGRCYSKLHEELQKPDPPSKDWYTSPAISCHRAMRSTSHRRSWELTSLAIRHHNELQLQAVETDFWSSPDKSTAHARRSALFIR